MITPEERLTLLCDHWPFLMSQVPGGLQYNTDVMPIDNARHWNEVIENYVDYCNSHKVNLIGSCTEFPLEYKEVVLSLCVSGNLRKIRNKWKRALRSMGIDPDTILWRRTDGRIHDIWAPVWKEWREYVYKLHGAECPKHV